MKNYKIEIRVSLDEKELMKQKAEASGLTLSDFSRRAILGQKITCKLNSHELKIYQELHYYRRGFASIGNMFSKRDPQLNAATREMIDKINKHLGKFT